MRRRQKMYRSVLRSAAALAASLVFVSALFTVPVQEKTYESTALLANAVGVFAGTAPNPYNTKALALAEKEAELNEREAMLAQAQTPPRESGYDLLSLVALALSALVLLLVSLNFYFDHARAQEEHRGPFKHT